MARDDALYLTYIDESVGLLITYTSEGKPRFMSDVGNQDQVIRRLETIADATARLSDDLKARHPEIAWNQIRAFRNRMAHGYLDVDLERVWEAVELLPQLREAVLRELAR